MPKYKDSIIYLIFVLIGFIYGLIKLQPDIVNVYNTNKSIGEKTIESADLDRKLETLKASEMENNTVSEQVKSIYKPGDAGVDTESSFSVIFDDIIEIAKYNGIKIYSIGYAYNPVDDDFVKGAPDKYNVCELTMQVIADYQDLEGFLKEVYKYPNLVNIENVELAPYQKDKKILIANVKLKLYSSK